MRTLRMEELKPGKSVWLEDNGLAFKTMRLRRAFILRVSPASVVFFPFLRLPAASYSKELTWRCWDERPELDTVCETEWVTS